MQGYIDEFYIFNKTLKELEIQNLISKCTGAKSNVILQLTFEKNMGNISLDTSGMQNDVTIVGMNTENMGKFVRESTHGTRAIVL